MLSPVLAPRVARMVPFWRETRCVRPSWLPAATTVLVGLIAREVKGPASKRASVPRGRVSTVITKRGLAGVFDTLSGYFPGNCS